MDKTVGHDKHKGEDCYIVGMAPSLLRLKKEDFGDGIVIALYQSIAIVEEFDLPNKIYSMQKDKVFDRKFITVPKKATLLLHEIESAEENFFPYYEDKIVWNNEKLGIPWSSGSAPSAIALARFMGCKNVYMLCFDGCYNRDWRRCNLVNGEWVVSEVDRGLFPMKGYEHDYQKYCDDIRHMKGIIKKI